MTKTLRVFETGSVFMDILMENTPQNVVCSAESADLGVIMPGFSGKVMGEFKILLIPGDMKVLHAGAEYAVTYGMSPCDTITLSSVGVDRCVLAVQREVRTVFGKKIEPQEIIIPRMKLAPDYVMASWAALLLAGVDVREKTE